MKLVYMYIGIPEEIKEFWLNEMTDFNDIITSIDIVNYDKGKAIQVLKKSLDEQQSRINNAKNESQRITAEKIKADLEVTFINLQEGTDVLKEVFIRIYVKAKTLN